MAKNSPEGGANLVDILGAHPSQDTAAISEGKAAAMHILEHPEDLAATIAMIIEKDEKQYFPRTTIGAINHLIGAGKPEIAIHLGSLCIEALDIDLREYYGAHLRRSLKRACEAAGDAKGLIRWTRLELEVYEEACEDTGEKESDSSGIAHRLLEVAKAYELDGQTAKTREIAIRILNLPGANVTEDWADEDKARLTDWCKNLV